MATNWEHTRNSDRVWPRTSQFHHRESFHHSTFDMTTRALITLKNVRISAGISDLFCQCFLVARACNKHNISFELPIVVLPVLNTRLQSNVTSPTFRQEPSLYMWLYIFERFLHLLCRISVNRTVS